MVWSPQKKRVPSDDPCKIFTFHVRPRFLPRPDTRHPPSCDFPNVVPVEIGQFGGGEKIGDLVLNPICYCNCRYEFVEPRFCLSQTKKVVYFDVFINFFSCLSEAWFRLCRVMLCFCVVETNTPYIYILKKPFGVSPSTKVFSYKLSQGRWISYPPSFKMSSQGVCKNKAGSRVFMVDPCLMKKLNKMIYDQN